MSRRESEEGVAEGWGEGALVAAVAAVVVVVVVGGSNQLLEKYCLSIPCQELVCVVAFFFSGPA